MAIDDFEGDTLVAFLDISGFKKFMKDGDKALKALDTLYNGGFLILQEQTTVNGHRVDGVFISDSAILFVRNLDENNVVVEDAFNSLLKVIKEINIKMLDHKFMLTTSIAYGKFKYEKRTEFVGLQKSAVYGSAYVDAFYDNEYGNPKIQPGQCRILKSREINEFLESHDLINIIGGRVESYNYYWNVGDSNQISRFERDYKKAQDAQYEQMYTALKEYV